MAFWVFFAKMTTKFKPSDNNRADVLEHSAVSIYHDILTVKPTICTNFSNWFQNETLHISDSSSLHYQELFTVHTAMVYVIQLSSRIRMELQFNPDPSRKLSTNLYDIPLMCLQWKTPNDGQRICPKHVDFHCEINLES
jgi:hypothetical protein